jgi:hypothetical protein
MADNKPIVLVSEDNAKDIIRKYLIGVMDILQKYIKDEKKKEIADKRLTGEIDKKVEDITDYILEQIKAINGNTAEPVAEPAAPAPEPAPEPASASASASTTDELEDKEAAAPAIAADGQPVAQTAQTTADTAVPAVDTAVPAAETQQVDKRIIDKIALGKQDGGGRKNNKSKQNKDKKSKQNKDKKCLKKKNK